MMTPPKPAVTLGWTSEIQGDRLFGSPDHGAFLRDHVLSRLDTLNRPSKILEPSGLMWGAAKRQSVVSSEAAEGFRVYSRNGAVIGGRADQETSLASHLSEQAQASKSLVKKYFHSAGVPVPAGQTFDSSEGRQAAAYAKSLGWRVALKPEARTAGSAASVYLDNEEKFRRAWEHLDPTAPGGALVEAHQSGLSLRVFVVGERVAGAVVRLPMFVVGDGRRNVLELLRELMAWRSQSIFLRRMSPTWEMLESRLMRLGVSTAAVPPAGDVQVVQETPSIHGGGLSVDVTEQLSEDLRDLAVDALWALPGLRAGGIDLTVPSLRSSAGAVAIGVDSRASIQLHEYPTFGRSRSIAGALITQFLASGRAPLR